MFLFPKGWKGCCEIGEIIQNARGGYVVSENDSPLQAIERQARRKLLYLHRARNLKDLIQPPGNMLESLKGDRKGQHSIRINDQWRICFLWKDNDAHHVEIVDYH